MKIRNALLISLLIIIALAGAGALCFSDRCPPPGACDCGPGWHCLETIIVDLDTGHECPYQTCVPDKE